MGLGKDIPGRNILDTVYTIVPGWGKARRAGVGLGKDILGQGILNTVYTIVPGCGKARRAEVGLGKILKLKLFPANQYFTRHLLFGDQGEFTGI